MKLNFFKYVLLFLIVFFTSFQGFTQGSINSNPCGFDVLHQRMLEQNQNYRQKQENFEQFLRMGQYVPKSGEVHKIPVVVHVMETGNSLTQITDQQIKDAIKALNDYFRKTPGSLGSGSGEDLEIEFALAVRNPDGNCTNGIVRVDMTGNTPYMNNGVNADNSDGISETNLKNMSKWDQTKYYNIWLVSEIDNNEGGSGTQGWAYFASAHGAGNDGALQLVNATKNISDRTLAHELGHALNLYHTFEGDDGGGYCPPVANGCGTGQGDCCADTPPHARSDSDCDSGGTNSCDGDSPNALFVHNYMDYSSNACQNMFTANQKTRARAAIETERKSLLQSEGNLSLISPSAPNNVDFYASSTVLCGTGQTVTLYDLTGCVPNTFTSSSSWENTTFSWTVTDGTNTYTSSSQNPTFTINQVGSFNVTLEVTNPHGTASATKQNFIYVSENPANSCSPSSTNTNNFWQTIHNVSFGAINNTTSEYINTPYTDFTCSQNTVVTENQTYTLSITANRNANDYNFKVYIDYNNNGTFEAGEVVHSGSLTTNGLQTFTADITVPTTATKNRLLRMRVAGEQGAVTENKVNCSSIFFIGDVEDYGIYILPECTTPTVTVPSTFSRCGAGTLTLTASTDLGELRWYNAAVDGDLLHTGASFTTPSISETTSYWVGAVNETCASARTEVLAKTDCSSTMSPTFCGSTIASNLGTQIECAPVAGAVSYRFEVTGPGGTSNVDRSTPYIHIYNIPNYNWNETYSIRVASSSDGVSYGTFGASCDVSSPATLTTQVQTSQCNTTLGATTDFIAADAVGTPHYRFRINGGEHSNHVITKTARWFYLSELPSYTLGQTYAVSVAVSINGTDFQDYGTACNITVPATISTQIQASQCNTTLGATTDFIAADNIGASHYRFRLTADGYDATTTKTVRWFYLSDLPSYAPNTTYAVTVAVSLDGGATFGAYGASCNITTPGLPTTQLQASQCNTTLGATTDFIAADNIGASHYRFRLTADGYDETTTKTVRWFYLSDLPSYAPNTTYAVTVAVSLDGGATFGAYGSSCNLTTPGLPTTQLQASQCNTTLGATTDFIAADHVGVTHYRFRLTADGYDETTTKTVRWFYLSDLPSYAPNTTYAVTVAVSIDGGATFGAYGSSCNLTTPGLPTTQLQASQCNTTLGATTDFIAADHVGVTHYRFRLTADGYDETTTKTVRWFYLSDLPSYAPSTTYAVTVAVSIDGGATFGAYGSSCNITTPEAEGMIVIGDNETKSPTHAIVDAYMNVYPNPSRGEVTVVSSHEGTYRVVNELGQIVQEFEITKEKNYQTRINLSNGVYFVTGVINDETVTKKVVVLNWD
jgi:hypothetical protein